MSESPYAPEFKAEPFWWEDAPRPSAESHGGPPPREVDVAIVGSGFTGLHAAIRTARAGRSTLVLDKDDAGWGCSSRNGGQLGNGLKAGHAELRWRYGERRALALRRESIAALEYTADFIAAEGIDCGFKRCGRFHAAHAPGRYEALARELRALPKELGVEWHMVPRAEQAQQIATRAYHGGVVFPQHAALDPGRYHLGLLRLATGAGARVVSHCRVNRLHRDAAGFRLRTAQGEVRARDVIVATNGYTSPLTPWLQRRVIPIGSYMIATEPTEPGLLDRLMPADRVISDTRRVIYYYRRSPCGRRVLFGGRVALQETNVRVSTPRLHRDLCAILPEMRSVRVTHGWMGFVAYTFDHLPHVGVHDGVHYAMGYCGSGVPFSGYLGMRIAQRLLGEAEGRTAFDELHFGTRPTYTGNPWFLGPAVAWHKLRDRLAS